MLKSFLFLLLINSSIFASSNEKLSLCGEDNRSLSFDSKVGRAIESEGHSASSGDVCTVTLIGKSCAISAGHCGGILSVVEFNTLASNNLGIQNSASEDVYEVDQNSMITTDNPFVRMEKPELDFAVFKLKPNRITNKYPGDVQGFYEVSNEDVRLGEVIQIAGYGADQFDLERNNAQKMTDGEVVFSELYSERLPLGIFYQIDTTIGDSGAALVSKRSGKVVGIHRSANCGDPNFPDEGNLGIRIVGNTAFQDAIRSCLDSE